VYVRRCRSDDTDGRFWTMLRGAGDSEAEVMLTIINLARAKLLCQDTIDVKATDVGKTARTAVVFLLPHAGALITLLGLQGLW